MIALLCFVLAASLPKTPFAGVAAEGLEAEILILRHQLNVLRQSAPRRLYLRWADSRLLASPFRKFHPA
jgi:hypothetical protein